MQLKKSFLVAGVLAAITISTTFVTVFAQDNGAPPSMASPEHKLILERIGTFDADMTMSMGPEGTQKMQGVEVNTLLGDLWVLSDFSSDFGGFPFRGHGVMGWDPVKKKYFSLWVDVTEPSPMIMEGTYDAATKTMTFVGDNYQMGQKVRMRHTVKHKDADRCTFEMYNTGPDGKEMKVMQIDYTRRK